MDDLQKFDAYMAHLSERLGHVDRHAGLRGYTSGLMSPLQRKSVEPMAAHMDPLNVRSRHQSLHHFVADSNWSDEQMLLKVCQWVVPQMDFGDGGWWIIDDTGFPKQGRHSVGVARQYCGMLSKQDNCQVAVSVSLACAAASIPVAWQLYLPQEWADDAARREKAGVPESVAFATKPAIALQRIEHLMAQGAPRHCVLADAGYGIETAFRERLTALGLQYAVGITGSTTVWPPGHAPLPPKAHRGNGRVPTLLRRGATAEQRPLSVKDVAFEIDPDDWHEVTWREGTNAPLRSQFARVRGARRTSRLLAQRAARGGVVDHRVARGPRRTDEILAVHAARGHAARAHGLRDKNALAHRTRLPGSQAGPGTRPVRRKGLARLSPPHQPEHCCLRFPAWTTAETSRRSRW